MARPIVVSSNDIERFSALYSDGPVEECWLWRGCVMQTGYGKIGFGKWEFLAHRVSYVVNVGQIPDGYLVLHHCDNRQCVNPNHLFLGTNKRNSDDKLEKGRGNHARGVKCHFCKLTESQVDDIRKRYRRTSHSASNAKELAREFNVSKNAILGILSGDTWKHIAK